MVFSAAMRRSILVFALSALWLSGCPSGTSPCVGAECGAEDGGQDVPVGGGAGDAGSGHDGGFHDGGFHDGGFHDGGSRQDGGEQDGGQQDGGQQDGGQQDGGQQDGGQQDGGREQDGGEQDAGPDPDAGFVQLDAGTSSGSCGSPHALTFNSSGRAMVSGLLASTPGTLSDPNCLSSGAEQVYSFTVDGSRAFRATVTPISSELRPTLMLRGSPCATNRRDCAMYGSSVTTLAVSPLDPGSYFVVVDSDGSDGMYVLSVELTETLPKFGESCDAPNRTSIGGSTIGSQMSGGSLTAFSNDNTTSTCDGSGPDLVYKLNLTEPRKVTLSLAASLSPTYRPVLYLQRGTCSLSGSAECHAAPSAGGTASLSFASLPPGTYYVWLDGHSGSSGSYTFSYSLQAP